MDLRLVRNQWLLIDPEIQFLMSAENEDKTSGDFREMGVRLANEVIAFLKKKMDKASRRGILKDIKLSFVGHSIGNLIIRTALAGIYAKSLEGRYHSLLYSSNFKLGKVIQFFLTNSRERDGAISKILIYVCVDIGSTLGLYVQFELSIQFRAVVIEEVQGHTMHPSTNLYR